MNKSLFNCTYIYIREKYFFFIFFTNATFWVEIGREGERAIWGKGGGDIFTEAGGGG